MRYDFPTTCLLCGATVTGLLPNLCPDCLGDLPRTGAACPVCATPLPKSAICPACQRHRPPFGLTLAPFHYAPPVNHLVVLMKFRGNLAAARVLGELLAEYLLESPLEKPEMLIPIPLHASRLRARGFNQAVELSREIGRRWQLPVRTDRVIRQRATLPQTELRDRAARARNVRRAFALAGPVSGVEHVALLDDVMTSGATVTEVARLLRRAGVARVDVWCCCRAGGIN